MALNDNLKILEDSLEKARTYNDDKNYGRSFAHYLIVFQLLSEPESRQKYEKEFTNVLHIWGSILHNRKQFDDIFKCYHLAILYFPCSTDILNNLGVHALKLKNYKLAKTYFEEALNNERDFLPAQQNLQTTKFMLVERWHFPMLNDIKRNTSYGLAISAEISNGFRDVLDIGTGTGILSLFAAKTQKCRTITACDYSETMCDIATKVFRSNSDSSPIKLIKKSSTDLKIKSDLNKRATLLVTEILDSGVFGENILETLIHAWDHLLFSRPYAKIIPASVDIYVTAIQSDSLSRYIRINPVTSTFLKLNKLCLSYLPVPYDTENLKQLEDVCYMSDTHLALKVDFNNVRELKQLLNENNIFNVELNAIKSGRVDAFVVWFTLFLNENISITNSPFSKEDSCWEQAIFYLHHPLNILPNEEINIKMSCSKGYIDIYSIDEIVGHKCYMLPKNAILFLNDPVLMQNLKDIAQKKRKLRNISVLDLTPFPVLGLQLLAQKTAAKVTVKVNKNIRETIYKLCDLNGIDISGIQFVHDYERGDEKYDIIFQNFINPCGLLNEEEIYNSEILKYNLTDNGIYIPGDVVIYAQLVECKWLGNATKVFHDNCCGFNIAEFINEYKSTEQRDINLNRIPHIRLTDPIELGSVNTKNMFEACFTRKSSRIIENGCGNAIFYWFQLQLFDKDEYISSRRNNSFCNNASFILDTHKVFQINDNVHFVLKQHRGIIKIYVEN